jgi:hypothetical protein
MKHIAVIRMFDFHAKNLYYKILKRFHRLQSDLPFSNSDKKTLLFHYPTKVKKNYQYANMSIRHSGIILVA